MLTNLIQNFQTIDLPTSLAVSYSFFQGWVLLLTKGEGQIIAWRATGYVLERGVINQSSVSQGQPLECLGLICIEI